MAYRDIDLHPSPRVPGEELPRTGWRRPNLNWDKIWEWYDNFYDWQNILPKTGYSRDPSSVWYTHEWSPGIPVIPNMSRPPLYYRRSRKSFMHETSLEYNSSRSINNSSGSDWASMSSVEDVRQDVWYKRVTYMIKTVIVTITTTVLSVVKTKENHPHTNGFRPAELSFNDSEDDSFIDSKTKQDYWFIRVFKSLFATHVSVFVYLCHGIVMPFFKLFTWIMMVQTYVLSAFNSVFRLNRSRRMWALILLLVVPYLIIFGWRCETAMPSVIDAIVEDKNNIGWIYLPSDTVETRTSDAVETRASDAVETVTISDSEAIKAGLSSDYVFTSSDSVMINDIKRDVEVINTQWTLKLKEMSAKYDEMMRNMEQLKTQKQEQEKDMKAINTQWTQRLTEITSKYEEVMKSMDKLKEDNQKDVEAINIQLKRRLEEITAKYDEAMRNMEKSIPQNQVIPQVVRCEGNCHDIITDVIALPDYALSSSGGYVVGIRCSKSLQTEATYKLLGINVPWMSSSNPLNILQPSVYPGDCWCFEGSEGHIVVALSANITITSVTLEHAHQSVLPPGAFTSAPQRFNIIGLESETSLNGELLGEFSYQNSGKHLQQFQIVPTSRAYNVVELHILTNHGAAHTCVYRFRVHGTPQEGT